MKTRVFLTILILILFVAAGALAWLLGTTEGARWMMARLLEASPVAVRTERISGSLANKLTIEGLQVETPDWGVGVRKVSLSWQLLYLLRGDAVLKEVSVEKIVLTDKHPEIQNPLDLTWPQMPAALSFIGGRITEVRVDDFRYRTGNEERLIVQHLKGGLYWRFGTLEARNLFARSPEGSLAGSMKANFSRPGLAGKFDIALVKAPASQDRFSIAVNFLPADKPEQMAGDVLLTLSTHGQERFHVKGRLGIGTDRFVFHELICHESGRTGTVAVSGEILTSQPVPYARLRLEAKGLDLSAPLHFPALLSGTAELRGTVHRYEGSFALRQHNTAAAWQSVQAAGSFAGNESQIGIRDLNSRFLNGTCTGDLALSWKKDQRLSWNLRATNLDPAKLKADLQGKLNLHTTGFLDWGGKTPLEGVLKATLTDSVFQHRAITGLLNAQWQHNALRVSRCELRGRGLEFLVRGSLEQGLTYRFSVSESSKLLPVAGGPFTGSGVSRWKDGEWTGALETRFPSLFDRAQASWAWNDRGLDLRSEIYPQKEGVVKGRFTSTRPAALSLPDEGGFEITWNSMELKMLQDRIPAALDLRGRLDGSARGRLLKNTRFRLSAQTAVRSGRLSWKTDQGITAAAVERAEADLSWEDNTIRGRTVLNLAGYGRAEGTYEIPVPALFPLKIHRDGALNIAAAGEVREKGLLSVLFPGVIRESRGLMQFQIGATGTWDKPEWNGTATLSGVSAQLPTTGIRLENGRAEAVWQGNRIRISSFQLRSGEGDIRGSADVWMKNRQVERYEGRVTGKMFQAVYLPEIRLSVNPDLRFSGTLREAALTGDLTVHQALIQPSERPGMVKPSADVMITDRRQPIKKTVAFNLDTRVSVDMGDAFRVKASGIDALLAGKVLLASRGFEEPSLEGKINVVKGQFDRYGVKLDVHRGYLVFDSGPAETGQLDILAYRRVRDNQGEDIDAGVIITGPVKAPLIKLYSRPALNDSDILSYIVLGRPLKIDESKDQQDLLFAAAGALVASGPQSGSLQRQLKDRLGIDTIKLESQSIGGVSQSLATVGKYLAPNLYVAFGRSLFTSDYYWLARFSFLKNWNIESKMGFQTGADLFYKVEFD